MTIREIASETIGTVRDGIGAVLVWKTGRSWHYEILNSYEVRSKGVAMSQEDYDLYLKAKAVDDRAFYANGYYDNLCVSEEYGTVADLADAYKWQRESTDPAVTLTCEILCANTDAVEYIRQHPDDAYMVRPVTFHGFGIFHLLDDNRADCLARDMTREEANALVREGRDAGERDRLDARKAANARYDAIRQELIQALVATGYDGEHPDVKAIEARLDEAWAALRAA